MSIKGKRAVITGSNSGIGLGIAEELARLGSDVALNSFSDNDEDHALAKTIADAHGVRAVYIQADMSDGAACRSLIAKAAEALGGVDILVNNAGIQQARAIVETPVEEFDRMLAVHLRGAFLCSREAARHMGARGSGRIINVCSQLGYIGRANYTAYSTAKGGLIAFTRALARELAPQGVLVNGVSPGLVDTGFDPLSEEAKTEHARLLPLGRLGTPEDMTSAFVFLASDEGRYYCGQMFHPNGGEIMP
jgi:NAD(P)-dependent dehydrogenase (short-subunit alcohol dehydrogenase family)